MVCNPNLLTNWYFVGGGSQLGDGVFPINQLGLTSYTGSSWQGIDCWRRSSSHTIVTLSANGLIMTSDDNTTTRQLNQYNEYQLGFLNQTLTLSVLYSDNSLRQSTAKIPATLPEQSVTYLTVSHTNANNVQFRYSTSLGFAIRIETKLDTLTIGIAAMKLEFGDIQTLAHYENGVWVLNEIPNFDEQLLRCQRYRQIFDTSSKRPTYKEDFRPTLYKDPDLSTWTRDGTDYYLAEAALVY